MNAPAPQIDVVVRFHNIRRLAELERCISSLVMQTYRPLRIILTLQRFSHNDVLAVTEALAPLLEMDNPPILSVLNWNEPEPADGRSVLLNLGVEAADGRYIAFLDYDDVLYPEAYELLIARLRRTGAAIAFARVRTMELDVNPRFLYPRKTVRPTYTGNSLADLFRRNFCPLHSYVIDRSQLPPGLLQFEPSITIEEDYEALLRICATVSSDFGLAQIGVTVGDYNFKRDGSNTVPAGGAAAIEGETAVVYRYAKAAIEERRRTTLIMKPVERLLGLPETRRPRSVRQALDELPPSA